MQLSQSLISQIRQGHAILFLGAGATKGAIAGDGKEAPDGVELRDRIAAQFLKGDYSSMKGDVVDKLYKLPSHLNVLEIQVSYV